MEGSHREPLLPWRQEELELAVERGGVQGGDMDLLAGGDRRELARAGLR